MNNLSIKFKSTALVKEIESPENPGGLEKRVALTPSDVGELISAGVKVFVEYGAGLGVDFEDSEYLAKGAIMQNAEEIYQYKDMIIKFKGPSLDSISQMKKGVLSFVWHTFTSFQTERKCLKIHK